MFERKTDEGLSKLTPHRVLGNRFSGSALLAVKLRDHGDFERPGSLPLNKIVSIPALIRPSIRPALNPGRIFLTLCSSSHSHVFSNLVL